MIRIDSLYEVQSIRVDSQHMVDGAGRKRVMSHGHMVKPLPPRMQSTRTDKPTEVLYTC